MARTDANPPMPAFSGDTSLVQRVVSRLSAGSHAPVTCAIPNKKMTTNAHRDRKLIINLLTNDLRSAEL